MWLHQGGGVLPGKPKTPGLQWWSWNCQVPSNTCQLQLSIIVNNTKATCLNRFCNDYHWIGFIPSTIRISYWLYIYVCIYTLPYSTNIDQWYGILTYLYPPQNLSNCLSFAILFVKRIRLRLGSVRTFTSLHVFVFSSRSLHADTRGVP